MLSIVQFTRRYTCHFHRTLLSCSVNVEMHKKIVIHDRLEASCLSALPRPTPSLTSTLSPLLPPPFVASCSWESVVDTSGLVYLSQSYNWRRAEWKTIEGLERGLFVAAVLLSRRLGGASFQLLTGGLVLMMFQVKL